MKVAINSGIQIKYFFHHFRFWFVLFCFKKSASIETDTVIILWKKGLEEKNFYAVLVLGSLKWI
jgi:hypothetical protein